MKTLLNSVSSVHKNRVVETQPCLIVYVLSTAAFMLQWQRGIEETIWPANLIDLLTGPLQKKKLPTLVLGHCLKNFSEPHYCINEVQSHDLLYEETTNLPTYSSLLSPSLCHLHNLNSQFSSHTVLILFSQTALFLFLPLL